MSVTDLSNFTAGHLKRLADMMRKPGGWIPDRTQGATAGATISTPTFMFGIQSHIRMVIQSDTFAWMGMN